MGGVFTHRDISLHTRLSLCPLSVFLTVKPSRSTLINTDTVDFNMQSSSRTSAIAGLAPSHRFISATGRSATASIVDAPDKTSMQIATEAGGQIVMRMEPDYLADPDEMERAAVLTATRDYNNMLTQMQDGSEITGPMPIVYQGVPGGLYGEVSPIVVLVRHDESSTSIGNGEFRFTY